MWIVRGICRSHSDAQGIVGSFVPLDLRDSMTSLLGTPIVIEKGYVPNEKLCKIDFRYSAGISKPCLWANSYSAHMHHQFDCLITR